jgi:hypothetical protein
MFLKIPCIFKHVLFLVLLLVVQVINNYNFRWYLEHIAGKAEVVSTSTRE